MLNVTRLDLDGTGSPLGLVTKILAAEPNLPIPVPIEALAEKLDISEIAELTTEGFEGGLLTDEARAFGAILVRKGMDDRRRRFTIGHELGHFLILTHKPAVQGQFLCSSRDMLQWSTRDQVRAARMEVEANQFAAGILMPTPHLRRFLAHSGDPDLAQMLALHEQFNVSREAAARAYATHHSEPVAVLIVRDGKVLRIYRSQSFPRMCVEKGAHIPRASAYHGSGLSPGEMSALTSGDAGHWLESQWGSRLPELYEQVLRQRDGWAMIMLWCEIEDEDDYDPDEHKTAKERYRDRVSQRHSR